MTCQTCGGSGCAHRYGCIYMLANIKYLKCCDIKYEAG